MQLVPVLNNDTNFYWYLKKINKIPSLSQEEEFFLAKEYLEKNDLNAAHKLVTSHLKLVAKIALSYKNYGLPLNEIISEGSIGLMQAVKKFNPSLGFRLSTYAMCWIKAAIQEYILKSWSLVKIGTTAAQKKLFFSLNKIKKQLSSLYSRQITEADFPEIAKIAGVQTFEVLDMDKRLNNRDLSLNNSLNIDGTPHELLEIIPEKTPSIESSMIEKDDFLHKHQLLSEAIKTLKGRELDIFTQRKLQNSPTTLEVLSSKYNISKERVRQIENNSFNKIQKFILAKFPYQNTPMLSLNNIVNTIGVSNKNQRANNTGSREVTSDNITNFKAVNYS